MNRYEVYPVGDGWAYRSPDGSEHEEYETRGDAYAAARDARGDRRRDLYDGEGNFVKSEEITRGPEAIVLLRADGSVYGELSHAKSNSKNPIHKSLTPAGTNDNAGWEQ